MITIQEILEQTKNTMELTGETSVDMAWEFTFSTFRCAEEDGEELPFTCEQLEEAFNVSHPEA